MKEESDLTGTFTITVKDTKGNTLETVIKKGNIEERKMMYLVLGTDDYFPVAEQYIKNNYVTGDNLFSDEESLFGACVKLIQTVEFNEATQVDTPSDVDADFSIEGLDENGEKLLAHFSYPTVKTKKKIFNLVTTGVTNPFSLGEIILLECFKDGDMFTNYPELFTSASLIASKYVQYNEAVIKKIK